MTIVSAPGDTCPHTLPGSKLGHHEWGGNVSQSASATPGAVSRILTSDNVKTPATLTAQSAGRGTGHRDLLITQAPVVDSRQGQALLT